jgi:hypothetical protein
MKKVKSILMYFLLAPIAINSFGQANVNPGIAVLPGNSGVVAVGASLDLQITINVSGTGTVAVAKLRPVVTVPASVIFLADGLQTGLPLGWTIISNTGSQLRICNTTDPIAGGTTRNIILKVQGVTVSAAQTFSGQMNFGNGIAATCANGAAPPQNQTADDNSTSTITVTSAPVPLNLIEFKSTIINCEPSLHWTTTNEINTDRFEIERSNLNTTEWKKLGIVAASGYSNNTIDYNFTDKDIASSEKVIYRLKMIDQDGRFTYSKILPVLVNCKTASVLVYPNPIQDGKLYVTLAGVIGNADAYLVNMSGQKVVFKKMNNGSNDLNVTNIADGVYILNIMDNNGFNKNIKVTIGHK